MPLILNALVAANRYYAHRLINKSSSDLSLLATKTINVTEPGSLAAVRPYFRDADLNRLADTVSFSADELKKYFRKEEVELFPCRIHQFQSAYLLDGSLYLNGKTRVELRSATVERSPLSRLSLLPKAPRAFFEEAVLVAGVAGSTWFGHWLEDELPSHILVSNFGPSIAHIRSEYSHESAYRSLLHLADPQRLGTAAVRKLTYVDEFAQNASKARRYWRVREIIARAPPGAKRVFLRRGETGSSRIIVNEGALIERLTSEGFVAVDVTEPLAELLRVVNQAAVVVSVEGSHLAHALYAMQPFGTIVILNPPNQAHTTVADIAPFCELHAAMYIGKKERGLSFSVDPDDLMKFIDEALWDKRRRQLQLARFIEALKAVPVLEP